NLRAMLAPKRSEMRLVIQHYSNDRTLLAGNYAAAQAPQGRGGGGGGGGRGRGGADSVANNDSSATGRGGRGGRGGGNATDSLAATIPISRDRIARLKRFDLSWQAALDRLDAAKLSPAAQKDLDSLKNAIRADLGHLDAEATTLAQ